MKKALIALSIFCSGLLYAQVNVAVSIIPQQEFVKAIGGDKVKTMLMVLPGNEPHTYEPKPSQMKELSHANIYFLMGVEFEDAWIDRLKTQNPHLTFINSAKGIKRIPMVAHHHHDADHDADHNEDKEEGHLDPHIWTAPANIRIIAKNIYTTLISVDKKNASYYKKNFEAFNKKLDTIDKKIGTILKDVPKGTAFMVFHPAWGYFAKEYNLRQLPIEVAGKEPKPKELMQLIKIAKKEKVNAIFAEPEFSDKSAKIMAKELHLKVIKVSPLQKQWDKQLILMAKTIADK
jgi:zinc transport system substrate-binding protein